MSGTIEETGVLARVAPSLAGLVALSVMAALALGGGHSAYHHLLILWGVTPFRFPFLDVDGSLAAWECARKGVDVIIADPCDVLARGYNYSPFWMTIDWIPLGHPDRVWVGLVLGAGFLLSLSALPPPHSVAETVVRIAGALSTMVVFAIERANPDTLIFVLVLIALALLRRSAIARAASYGLFFLAGAIKYYPFILFGLMVRERLRLFLAIASISLIGLLFFLYVYAAPIREGLPHIAQGLPFGDMFGAKNVPFGVFMIVRDLTRSPAMAARVAALAMIVLFSAMVWIMTNLWRSGSFPNALERLDESRRLALFAGALLLSGCFFAGQSVAYRGIFLFLIIPGIFALERDPDAGATATAARAAAAIIPLLMWADAIRLWIHMAATGLYPPPGFYPILAPGQPWDLLAWLVEQIAWWFLIALLVNVLIGGLVVRPLLQLRGLRSSFRAEAQT